MRRWPGWLELRARARWIGQAARPVQRRGAVALPWRAILDVPLQQALGQGDRSAWNVRRCRRVECRDTGVYTIEESESMEIGTDKG